MDPLIKDLLGKTQLPWLLDRTIYVTRAGSHCYGLNTPQSDLDVRGIAIPPKEYFMGYLKHFEQADKFQNSELDACIYDLRKFIELAAACNPNVIEMLWTDPSDHLYVTPLGEKLLANRDLFLSKKARFTFMGYAIAQLKRIKTHRKWILDPPTQAPLRSDYGLNHDTTIPKDQLSAVQAEVAKQLDRWNDDPGIDMEQSTKIAIREYLSLYLAELKISDENRFEASARKLGMDENFIAYLQKERSFNVAKQQWEQFNNWKDTRNAKRAELERKYHYDCYSDDTEFLTDDGWKKFDDITDQHKLATVFVNNSTSVNQHRTHLGIEYQSPTEKFDTLYSGNMYQFKGSHLDLLVTANHRMLERTKSRRAQVASGPWKLTEAAHLPDMFEFLRAITPKTKNQNTQHHFQSLPISADAYLRLMGWYLSDGSMVFDTKHQPVDIRINQKKSGKLYSSMVKFVNKNKTMKASLHPNDHDSTTVKSCSVVEAVLSVCDKIIVQKLYNDCGDTTSKHIPRWVYSLPKRHMEVLFDAMAAGDGAIRNTSEKSVIHNCLGQLANDVNELAVLCGWETSVYGPCANEDKNLYRVHVWKQNTQTRTLTRTNVTKIPVTNQRIVCFSVPNGTLVVRRNGQVSFQGNCKHGLHLVRLVKMCREILTLGKVIVRRTEDREELLGIRNGEWSYEKLVEWADKEELEIDDLYKNCTILPHAPKANKIDDLCIEIVEESLRGC